jgi:hypothetical protein
MNDKAKKRRSSGALNEPQLGIFWLIKAKLVAEYAPLSEAECYGDHMTFAASHIDIWKRLQLQGCVPIENEYEEFPRGRVMYRPDAREFTILADRCILERKHVISEIKKKLHLPRQVKLSEDLHYRCSGCLYGSHVDIDELDD